MSGTILASAATKTAISQLLLSELERLGMSLYALAKAAGVGMQTVRAIVGGLSDPSLSRVLAIERGLGRPAGWGAKQLLVTVR